MLDALTLKHETVAEDETIRVIRLARGGDVAAFDLLIRRHERKVVRLAYQMVGNFDDAQDVAQEVYIRLWRYLDKIRDEARFATWLYRLVTNASYDLLKRRQALRSHLSFDDPSGRTPELADEAAVPLDRGMVAADLKEKVLEALGRLTPSERTVFVLKDIEGLDAKDIARIQEISAITVRRHLSNARHKMQKLLVELDAAPVANGRAAVGGNES